MVYVTHDQEEALSISDRVAVMNKGVLSSMERLGRSLQAQEQIRRRIRRGDEFPQVEIKEVRPSDDGTGASVVDFLWQDRVSALLLKMRIVTGQHRTLLLRPAIEPVGRDEEITDENTISGKVIDSSFWGRSPARIDVGGEDRVDDSKTKEHGVSEGKSN